MPDGKEIYVPEENDQVLISFAERQGISRGIKFLAKQLVFATISIAVTQL